MAGKVGVKVGVVAVVMMGSGVRVCTVVVMSVVVTGRFTGWGVQPG